MPAGILGPAGAICLGIAAGLLLAAVIAAVAGDSRGLFSRNRQIGRRTLALVLALSIVGSVAGFAGGMSRVGAVGDVIPAALALLGGVAIYLFGVEPGRGIVASVCAAGFGAALATAYAIGAEGRVPIEQESALRDSCVSSLADADILKDDKAFCRFITTSGEACADRLARDWARQEASTGMLTEDELIALHYRIQMENLDAILAGMQPACQPQIYGRYKKTPIPIQLGLPR